MLLISWTPIELNWKYDDMMITNTVDNNVYVHVPENSKNPVCCSLICVDCQNNVNKKQSFASNHNIKKPFDTT